MHLKKISAPIFKIGRFAFHERIKIDINKFEATSLKGFLFGFTDINASGLFYKLNILLIG